MTEEDKRRWDVALAVFGPLLTIVTIVVGLLQFSTGERNRLNEQIQSDDRRAKTEFQRQIWLQKAQAYQKIADITGKVVSAQEEAKGAQDEAYREFMNAYWGTMILVEDKDVEVAMKKFYLTLRDVRNGWPTPPDRLKERADELVSACRADMENTDTRQGLTGKVGNLSA